MDSTPQVDEHLAKFPPFKGPKIGGNFEVDENVLSGKKSLAGATYQLPTNARDISSSSNSRDRG
jgi:hypothetical protein